MQETSGEETGSTCWYCFIFTNVNDQWRPAPHEGKHCLLVSLPTMLLIFFFRRLKNRGQTLKTERRVITTRVGPSLGAYLSFELLADVLSVLLDEIMKSLFILIHIKILI